MKEEIKHFKSLLRQGSLRNMNILLDDKFQKELQTIIEDYEKLQQENKQLKEQLLVTQTNEETFRLEMKDITQTLGLDEDTLFDDVKVYVRSLKDNWNELKEYIKETKLKEFEKSYGKRYGKTFTQAEIIVCNMILNKMQELEGNDK
ncbi:MAG: hypothetical protein U0K48_05825 [Bacilli bacterium]|nr:hypothetical protein [Bacilli bacterium]